MKYFAVITMMAYGETALGTGEGDDYAMYRGLVIRASNFSRMTSTRSLARAAAAT
jgi:hypothetical protein